MKRRLNLKLKLAMSIGSQTSVFLAMLFTCAFIASTTAGACTEQEEMETPCECCKMRCWYNIQEQAVGVLGHIPGKYDDSESVDTLLMITDCVKLNCAGACAAQKRASPYNPMGIGGI